MTTYIRPSQKLPGKVEKQDNLRISSLALAIFIALVALVVLLLFWMDQARFPSLWFGLAAGVIMLAALYVLFGLKVALQWEKAVLLRLGKFRGLRRPGMFWIVPILDATPNWIDHRVMVTPFNAEKTLTKESFSPEPDVSRETSTQADSQAPLRCAQSSSASSIKSR